MAFRPKAIRTLIVDDSEMECSLLEAELRGATCVKVVAFVHDGFEAVAYLSGTDPFRNREKFPYPDLVLLDFQMPGSDGMDVLRFLHYQYHRPRVILWSNSMEEIDLPLASHLGADVVCRKPGNRAELLALIHHFEIRSRVPLPCAPPNFIRAHAA
jgi:CheY-like chemotaxis protein